jgi:hypothetical protein
VQLVGGVLLLLNSGGRQTAPSLDGGRAADGEVLVAQVATNVLQVKYTKDTIVFNMLKYSDNTIVFRKNTVLSTLWHFALVKNVVFAKLQYFCSFQKWFRLLLF